MWWRFQFTPFGFGKRICIGKTLAEVSIFIFFIMMLQNLKFDINPSLPRPSPDDIVTGMVLGNVLKPFYVRLSERK